MKKRRFLFFCFVISFLFLSSCNVKSAKFLKEYSGIIDNNNGYALISLDSDLRIDGFSKDLAVVSDNGLYSVSESLKTEAASASLYCIDDQSVLYADNVHEKLHPASITKIMTVLVALKYGNLDDIVTITDASKITESGAVTIGLETGDMISLRDLVYCALIYSGNDAAAAIAVHISGSIKDFANIMTNEAKALGATNTTFKNPHGLTEEGHMTTAYDIYLILNEAVKNETITDIINRQSYQYTYTKANGKEVTKKVTSTLRYFSNQYSYPSDIDIIGGRTGSTNAAGKCLALCVRHKESGKMYIAIILKSANVDSLYADMNKLLEFCE